VTVSTAPRPGSDPDFEEIIGRVMESVEAAGNPEGKTEEEIRETTAKNFAKYGSKTFAPGEPVKEDEPIVAQGPREITIPEPPAEPYWYEDPADARMFDHYVRSRRKLGSRVEGGLLIIGPAGSGKTKGVVKSIERLRREGEEIDLLVMNCPTLTDPQKWFGHRGINEEGDYYEKSAFINAVESGAVILLDEFMRLHPNIHNPIMSLMDGTEEVLLSDMNLVIRRHPQTIFIGTTNIGAAFGGTHRMDWAMRERWSYTIKRNFPPRDEEIKVLSRNNPGCDEDAAAVLVTIAEKTRDMWKTGDLRAPISTRTLGNAAFLVASGMTEREALSYTALPEFDDSADGSVGQESEQAKVRGIVSGATGRR
jgi:hypothetical protein